MVEADVDDFSIPFLGNNIRVSGYPRDDLWAIIAEPGFQIVEETSHSYATAVGVPPEEQIFLCYSMGFSRSGTMRISSVGKSAM